MRNFKIYTTTLLLFTLPLSSVESLPPPKTEKLLSSPTYTDIISFLNLIESGALKNVITEPEDLAQIAYFLTTLTLAGALPEEEILLEEKLQALLESVHLAQTSHYFGASKNLGDWKILLCRNFIEKAWDGIINHISENKTTYICIGGAVVGVGLIFFTGGSGTPFLSFVGGGVGAIGGKLGSNSLNRVPAYEQVRKIEPTARAELVHAIRGPSKGVPIAHDPEIIRERAASFVHEGLRAVSGEKTVLQENSAWLSSLNQQFSSLAEEEKAEAIASAWENFDRFLEPNLEISPLFSPEDHLFPLKKIRIPIHKHLPQFSPSGGLSFPNSVDLLYIELPPDTTRYGGKKELSPPVDALHPDVQQTLQKRRSAGSKEAEPFFSSFFTSPLKWHDKTPYNREFLKECIRDTNEEKGKKHLENISLSFAVKVGKYESPKMSVFFLNGMCTNDVETLDIATFISDLLEGLKVAGCHNPTEGSKVRDASKVLCGKSNTPLQIDEETCICIVDELERIGPDGIMCVVAYSQGGIIFYQATKSLDEAVRNQMVVNTLGTTKVISSEEYRQTNNFIADDDGIAKAINLIYFTEIFPRKDVTILEPVEGSTGHPLMSPTYQKGLEDIAKLIKTHERQKDGRLENSKPTEHNEIEQPAEKPRMEQPAEAGKWDK